MSPLRIAFLDVGQGDTTVIYDPDSKEAVIVDCANSVSALQFLKSEGITRLRALVLTHPHLDHYAAAVTLFENCGAHNIVWDAWIMRWDKAFGRIPSILVDADRHSAMLGDDRVQKSALTKLYAWSRQSENKKKHIEPHQLAKVQRITQSLDFLHPLHPDVQELFETGNLNNLSYVIKVSDGESALLAGDIEPAGWEFLRANHQNLQSEILKFPHHGGAWDGQSVANLLDEVKPQFVIISVGTRNAYNHPSDAVFTEIRQHPKTRLLCTEATPKCGQDLDIQTKEILSLVKKRNKLGALISQRARGCPCAGTIIVELGDEAKVIDPDILFHQHQIIRSHLTTPQCIPLGTAWL